MGVLGECLMLLILTKEMLLHEFFFFGPNCKRVGDGAFELRFLLVGRTRQFH